MNNADLSSPELAREIARELARHLTDIVICPGSRNSSLSLALIARGDIRIHSRIDERSAAFLALGMARATGRHVGVLMTSGSAVANCHPAVIESLHSHTPLAIISADRPRYLVGTGANQTIDQHQIFGQPTIDISTQADIGALDTAFEHTFVHINCHFAQPLVDSMPPGEPPVEKVQGGIKRVDHGEVTLDLSKRTLVIAGDEAWRVPGLEDVPTIAEPSAPAPYHPVHPLAASLFHSTHVSADGYVVETKPEQVVVVGHPTLHRDVMNLLHDERIELIILSRTAQLTNPARREAQCGSRIKTTGEVSAEWIKICHAASELAIEAVREAIAHPDYGFTGLHVAAAVADSVGVGDTLFIGPSNPVRDISFVGAPFDGVDLYTPRGAAGIDGNLSQATGIALAVQAREPDLIRAPHTLALVGDITFLHDCGGLLTPVYSPVAENFTIVVANDDGGGIFETIEVGDQSYAPGFELAFGTTHGVDIEALSAAYGYDYERVDSLAELLRALDDAGEQPGIKIIEAKTVRDTRRVMHQELQQKVRFSARD
ncbi:2-succinyl-5-enolpyruvyl-6-hydroxy-3-cyclohexene-1-carboxylic-acid synthase [Corynebacterium sp. ES2794-CONJ1]|uniref:2-succinyl-5-enolpyruvyl-6-hydroxy-3- cyclohexene-1-carboxylic-acid synthase n=1 Tax=unclassified Corynebacterium TaxID=2624378 RepID=UPI002167E8B5|nr:MULTISPECIES: 2-succinyl-5-enolpyruvyl-6-hydroxy-3-cyclohexene-1-carboxylic-acid synthase [unclassified Corynebacterium]MCS4491293.1 2-succinyl-5-enolpyruvyl-6-hydroxy-3-cyclohexene-1-carboxylic-acid synthase [Corynebacterium sp. ES2715-CONJ3]MCU9519005.1 2-succinyl-5-enolpyruvyl-6-hydroxy-3-cyclohexene-1-carboxylic-acid synthase [Corynebacterium sp. ES2794-CONJ1]